MRRSRRSTHDDIDGVLLVDKGTDMTSHDVVAVARRVIDQKKIGHCGTLDPLATGLLILVLGKGTKIQDLLMSEDKEYEGTIRLGQVTGILVATRIRSMCFASRMRSKICSS